MAPRTGLSGGPVLIRSALAQVRDTTVCKNLATGLLVGGTCRCRVEGCKLLANLKDGVGVAARAAVVLEGCQVTRPAESPVTSRAKTTFTRARDESPITSLALQYF